MYFLIRKEFYDNTICEENILPVESVERSEGTTRETRMNVKWNKRENSKYVQLV